MADEGKQIKEYFASVEMTEEFKQRLLALPREADASPKARPARRGWKPLTVAAALALICLVGVPLLRAHQTVTPEVLPTTRAPLPTQTVPGPGTTGTEPGMLPTEPAPTTAPPVTETQPAAPVGSTSVTAPPFPNDPTDPTDPTEPTSPIDPTTPTVPTDPTQPVTEPTQPVTEPTQPVTEPTQIVTEPPEPVTEPPEPNTEPTEDFPEPMIPGGETEETPAEDLGWAWEVLRTAEGDFLRVTDAAGEVCVLDLTGLLDAGEVCGSFWIFEQERSIRLCANWDGGWLLYVLEGP